MTIGIPNTVEPSAQEMARQAARWIAQHGEFVAGTPLVFIEADQASPAGGVYACPMPARGERAETCLSVTVSGAQPAAEADNPTRRTILEFTARAATMPLAMAALEEARRLLRPDQRPFLMPPFASGGAFDARGIIGYPPPGTIGAGGAALWRVLDIEIVSEPQPAAFEASPAATGEGEAEAVMTIALRGVAATMPQPSAALRVWHDATGGVLSATAEVRGATGRARTLRLRRETAADVFAEQTIDLAGVADLNALRAAVTALGTGWTSDVAGGWTDWGGRDARDLLIAPRAAALGAGSKVTMWVTA